MQETVEESGFEKFETGKIKKAPKASIRKNAQIAISTGAVREYDFRDDQGGLTYKYFILYFNNRKKQIGLYPTNEKSENVVKARDHVSGEIQIAAKSFLNHNGVPYDETRRFPIEYNDNMGLYVIDLVGIKDQIGD